MTYLPPAKSASSSPTYYGVGAAAPRGFSVPSTKPIKILGRRSSETLHFRPPGKQHFRMRAIICVASSKDRSSAWRRRWNSRSPGVETAWRAPARISRKGCNSRGRGRPKRRSHASDPNPMTQESPPSRSRNSTARTSAARSPQSERRVARFSEPGLERRDQEDRGASERRGYCLRESRRSICRFGCVRRTDLIECCPARERISLISLQTSTSFRTTRNSACRSSFCVASRAFSSG